uniref:RNA polymerase beta'' subunit n=1 Tax=Botrychium ternatum TaxID=208695 RepID=UPI001EDCD70E|nr:RNA polymerase beta'' subunit [Botrychium ternatum]UHY94407.1 RNA polymerase beta'' subunit [Botrychium ternatum]
MADRAKFLSYNKVMDRTAIKRLISRLIAHSGITYTANIPDQPKTLGFQRATNASISLGIDDLLTAPSKAWLVRDAEKQGSILEQHHRHGSVHAVERLRQSIETWYATSEYPKREMNPNFGVTDPLNPVHMMSFSGARGSLSQVHQLVGMRGLVSDPQGQIIDLPIQSNPREGLSLTEYITSCYGARKGVVDTAVRTSDAGYPTRRLVEVVQHIVVRKTDCGTTGGIIVNPTQDRDVSVRNIPQQKLIGRVLADNICVDMRCIAIRNQDIGNEPADRLVSLRVQPIRIRSPLTCRNISWICRLCYGWSLTHHDLVELGEAVGIIAGQSIGEPGTQLTLRTFHTGGVFTGDIAEHVRTPFNGIISFDGDSVHPARTRHGHPAWICQDDLSVSVKGRDGVYNFVAPPQSLILVRNDQHVESKQVVAEVRADKSPPKEGVRKHIHSDSEGEMHWGTTVRHSSDHVHSNVYPILKTGHVWVLSGGICDAGEAPSLFYKDQDRIDSQPLLTKYESLPYYHKGNNGKEVQSADPHREEQIFNHSKFDSRTASKILDSLYYLSILRSCSMRRNGVNGRVILPMKRGGGMGYNKALHVNFVPRIPKNGILNRGDVPAVSENPEYRTNIPGIIKYGTIKADSTAERECIPEDGRETSSISRYRVLEGGNFFFLPEEVYIIHQSHPFLLVSNNGIVQAGERITPNISSRLGGLVRTRKIQNSLEIRVLPGDVYYPGRISGVSRQNNTSIPPGNSVFDNSKSENWIYLQWITPHRRKAFALARPVAEYAVPNESFLDIAIPDPPKKRNPLQIRIQAIKYMLYEDGEEIRAINDANTQLVQTCLVLDWEEESSTEPAHASIPELRVKNIPRTFLHISPLNYPDSYAGRDRGGSSSKRIYRNKFPCTDYSLGNPESQSPIKYQGTIRSVPGRGTSFSIPSSPNFFQSSLYTNPRYSNGVNQSGKNPELGGSNRVCTESLPEVSKNHSLHGAVISSEGSSDPGVASTDSVPSSNHIHMMRGVNGLGLLGNSHSTANCSLYPCGVSRNVILSQKVSFIDNSRYIFRIPNRYFLGGGGRIIRGFGSIDSTGRNNLYRVLDLPDPHNGGALPVNLGQYIRGNVCSSEGKISSQSGQIISIHRESLTIRSAKPYSATEGATVHSHYGDILGEGNTLITLIYERFKSGDIIQGLPKVEQLLEARSTNSVSSNLENAFGDWSRGMTKLIGNSWSRFLGARISMEQSRTDSVDQIQRVY